MAGVRGGGSMLDGGANARDGGRVQAEGREGGRGGTTRVSSWWRNSWVALWGHRVKRLTPNEPVLFCFRLRCAQPALLRSGPCLALHGHRFDEHTRDVDPFECFKNAALMTHPLTSVSKVFVHPCSTPGLYPAFARGRIVGSHDSRTPVRGCCGLARGFGVTPPGIAPSPSPPIQTSHSRPLLGSTYRTSGRNPQAGPNPLVLHPRLVELTVHATARQRR